MDSKHSLENLNTTLVSESEPESAKKSTPIRRRRRRKDRAFIPDFNIPGVYKLVLSDLTQESIGCIAGDTVTAEKPWLNVDKEAILEHVENFPDSSEFMFLKNRIGEFPGDEILMGYIPDESKEVDEFYICITEEAQKAVNEIVEKLTKLQEDRLKNAIHRKIKRWKTHGSEKEIEETQIKYNRSLIEVEIESKYPILPFKVHFRRIKTQDLRDGYMELRPSEDSASTITKKRIDACIQVAPSVTSNHAQTVCTYPKNSYTQYEYTPPEIETDLKNFSKVESIYDILKVNGCINLYSNDYEDLVLNPKMSIRISTSDNVEYICFIEMNLCGNKMISSLCWHPMWSGCVIASYVDIAPPLFLKTHLNIDEVSKAVHDTNPVLFWSFNDDLKPKLILETPRPVYSLSVCPNNANLIIGGCLNGQIILWDITNKLKIVEEEEILTVNQQKYREYMFELMSWMKNIFDVTKVRPTAISDLKYSHKGCVTAIDWLSPFFKTSKTGKIDPCTEGLSLEFITAAEDGTILIWDLLKKPVIEPGGFKAMRKLRRLKKKPSALSTMESPFHILHLNLKPIYKINLVAPSQNNRLLGISTMYTNFFKTHYENIARENRKSTKLSDRQIFRPLLGLFGSNDRKTFYVGSIEGDYIQGIWEGQEFDSGEMVNFENCQFVNFGKIHDGPVVSVDYSPKNDTVLTVGGKVFALWRENFKNRPILWRQCKSIYTNGSWFMFEQASIKLVRIDGYMEIWSLFNQSKTPLEDKLMSNGAVTLCTTHPRKIQKNIFGLCDYRGSVRLFYKAHLSPLIIKAKEDYMSEFLTKEIERKKNFLKWQETWNQRHFKPVQVVEKEAEAVSEIVESKKKEEKKKIAKISPGQRYLETVQEQHKIHEQQRIKSVILMKKQLDTEDLLKKREPLRKLEEENEVKKRKQKKKLKESDKIFKETVAMLFPDVVKEKPVPPPDPYEDSYSDENKRRQFDDSQRLNREATNFVEENPFSYDFSWGTVLKTGRERRRKLDEGCERDAHLRRYAKVKEEKKKMAEVLEEETVKSLADSEEMSIMTEQSNATNF